MDKTQQLMVFAIDDKLRTITMPNNGSVFGVSGDIEVNQVEFQMPRYCAGFDMTDFTGRVNYVNPNGDSNYYESEISVSNCIRSRTERFSNSSTQDQLSVEFF